MTDAVSEDLEKDHAVVIQQAASQFMAGQYAEAEAACAEILQKEPEYFDALHLLGILKAHTDRLDEAETAFMRALQANPESPDVNRNLANVYNLLKRNEDAVIHYKKALVEGNTQVYIECVKSMAGVLERMGRFEEIEQIGNRAIELFPENPLLYNCVAVALLNLSRHEEALFFCNKAIELAPDFSEAYNNAAVALIEMGCMEEALARCNTALAISANNPEINCTISSVLIRLSRFEEALVHADWACSLRPDGAVENLNAAVALSYLRKFPESIARFDRAIAAAPDDPDTQLRQGFVRLLTGDYELGFKAHEARLLSRKSASTLALPKLEQPRLTSLEMARGKSVLVYQEQGIGDAIHFLRYVPMLSKIAGAVYYSPPQALLNLVNDSFGNMAHVLYPSEQFPSFDYHCSVMSLAYLFGTTRKNIPASIPYLQADPQKILGWKKRLASLSGIKVGLVWAGNPKFKSDRMRSMPLQTLAPLLKQQRVSFISLQKECPSRDADFLRSSNVTHFGDELEDFSDTAALVECMDLVIATDTSVPHLVGALGRPLWLLLGTHADWRWGLDGEDCAWYPTARLFRKRNANDWTETIDIVTHELDRYRRRNWLRRLLSVN